MHLLLFHEELFFNVEPENVFKSKQLVWYADSILLLLNLGHVSTRNQVAVFIYKRTLLTMTACTVVHFVTLKDTSGLDGSKAPGVVRSISVHVKLSRLFQCLPNQSMSVGRVQNCPKSPRKEETSCIEDGGRIE